jgi:peptide/nickel transport system substrate-binding protein
LRNLSINFWFSTIRTSRSIKFPVSCYICNKFFELYYVISLLLFQRSKPKEEFNPGMENPLRNYQSFMSFNQERILMKFKLLNVLIMFIFGLLIFTPGCKPAGTVRKDDNTIRIALRSDPVSLNPILASESASMMANGYMFNTLVKYSENLEITPDLAESWELKDKGRVIIFHLKKGVKWHDGAEFTSADVVFTFDKILDPDTNTFNAGLFKIGSEKIRFEAIDDHTVKATLPSPFAPFFNNLTLAPIAPAHLLKNENINQTEFNRNPIGTGPFKFVEWKTSERIVLQANPDYFKGKPKIDRIELRIIPSGEGARIALMSEQIDMAALSAEDMFVMSRMNNASPNVEIHKWKDFIYFYLAFDLTNPLFQEKEVRIAINHAIDKKSLTESVMHGFASPINGPIPAASWAYIPDSAKYDYNPELANKILEEAGWKKGSDGIREKNGRKLSFKIIYKNGSQASEGACIQMQSYLKTVGIEVKLQTLDFGALINALYPGKFEAVVFDWVEPFDPDIYTEWHSSQCGSDGMNFMTYKNPDVDKLLEKGRITFDLAERKSIYAEVQKKISADAPYIWLWNPESAMGVNKRITGLSKASPAGLMIDPEKVGIRK